MIITQIYKTYIFAICLFFSFTYNITSFAQTRIEGTVTHNGKPLQGADVLIINSAGTEKVLTTNSAGAYSFNFPPNEEYDISISKVGFTQFQIIYSTMGLTGEAAKKFKSTSKPVSELFELPSDQATILKLNAILDKPLLSYYFNSEKNTIDSDENLEQSLTQSLAKVAQLSGAQSSTIETNYKNALAKGDAALQAKNYDLAKSAYNEALAAKPGEQYPKTKLADVDKAIADAEAKGKADAAEKERLAKEKALADAAAKDKAEKDKELAAAAAKEKAEKDKALAASAAEKAAAELAEKNKLAKEKADKDKAAADAIETERLAKEKDKADAIAKAKADADKAAKELADKAAAELAEKNKLAKEKADKDKAAADAAEAERLVKEKEKADAIAKAKADADKAAKELADKAAAELAEKNKLAKEKADKDKAAADAAEAERLAKEKEKADAIAKAKADANKALAEQAEKERIAKETELKLVQTKYDNAIAKGDSCVKAKSYDMAKTSYTSAASLKPKETIPATKIKEVDALIETEKRSLYTNELAKKYPQGVTEEKEKEGNANITKRIVVKGNTGNLYIKKETGFGATYYFKDGATITETEFIKNTEGLK
jgi:colicin import membrane protein